MNNEDKKNNELNQSSNMFDDDLFSTSSSDLFGSSNDLFNSSNDLFKNDNKDEEQIIDKKRDKEQTENKQENLKENNIEFDKKINAKKEMKDKKEEKDKKKENKKKTSLKIKLIICTIIFIILLTSVVACGILYYKKISTKLETPTLKIEKLYNSVVLESSEVAKTTGYEFVISVDDASPITLKSNTNKKELDLENYKKLTAKVRCLGKVAKAHSNYSVEQTLSNKIKLKMSTVFVDGLTEIKNGEKVVGYQTNENINDDKLTWESVANASKYYVYYKADVETDEVKKYEVTHTQGTITFNLSQIYTENGSGYYNISVVAVPENKEYFEISDYSDVKIVEYFTQQEKVKYAELNNNTLAIYTNLIFNATKLSLSFNYGIMTGVIEHQLIVEDLIKEESIYEGKLALKFTVDISEFVKEDLEGISIVVLGDGKYSTDSDSFVVG